MGKVLALMNEKGGVGKSVLTFSCAWRMAELGYRILIIDMDGQTANATYLAGISTDAKTLTMADVLLRDTAPKDCVVNVMSEGSGVLDMIPAANELASLSSTAKISRMKKAVRELAKDYDFIYLDVNPSPDWRHALTLSVLDGICIVMLPDILSLAANSGIFESIEEVQEGTNMDLRIIGFVLNRFDARTRLSRAVLEKAQEMADYCGSSLFESRIRKAVALSESASAHVGVTHYAPSSAVAADVRALTDEIISRL